MANLDKIPTQNIGPFREFYNRFVDLQHTLASSTGAKVLAFFLL
jgi:hypothetical protein